MNYIQSKQNRLYVFSPEQYTPTLFNLTQCYEVKKFELTTVLLTCKSNPDFTKYSPLKHKTEFMKSRQSCVYNAIYI